MSEDNIYKIMTKLESLAAIHNLKVSKNLEKIAKVKERFFGIDAWEKCPCDRESDRACISQMCKNDIEKEGICHCNLFEKVL